MKVKGVLVVGGAGPRNDSVHPGGLDALQEVANRPIAHHVLDALTAAGVEQLVVVCPDVWAAEVRESLDCAPGAKGAELAYVEHDGPVDLISAIELAAPVIGSAPCVLHVANGLLADPLTPLLAYLRGDSPHAVVLVHQGHPPITRLSPETLQMLHVAELDPDHDGLGMAGVCLFGRGALRRAGAAQWRSAGDLDLTALAHQISEAGGTFHVLPTSDWRSYAGEPADLLEVNRIALDRLDGRPSYPPNHGNRFEGRVWIHRDATVRASMIVGPTVIGPGAHVADAYIGPYTSVGAHVRIEGTEIERSIIAPGASIMHVGGRLVASVVGRNARIFRDFSVPRAMRLQVGDGTEVALC